MSLEKYLSEAERCSLCSYCKWIPFDKVKSHRFAYCCPSIAYNNFNSYSARGRYAVTRSLIKGEVDYTDALKDTVFQCLACGACDVSCKVCRYNLEPLEMMLELRAHLVKNGQIVPEHQRCIESLIKDDNMKLGAKADRGAWADGLTVKRIYSEPAEVLFHAGCNFSYDTELPDVARAAVQVLQDAGVDVGIMGNEEMCCGALAYQIGFREEFANTAEKVIEKLKKYGVKTIVTTCPNCYYAFTHLYPQLGANFEVLHSVQMFEQLIDEGKITFKNTVPLKVTYHDPCHLGRLGEPYTPWEGKEIKVRNQIVAYDPPKPRYNGAKGVYDAPRKILESIPGIELVEMERIREYAWCCGAGGGAREAYPEFSQWTARERIEEAKSTGAEALVTACGACERNFIDAIKGGNEAIKVMDIAQLLRQATEGRI